MQAERDGLKGELERARKDLEDAKSTSSTAGSTSMPTTASDGSSLAEEERAKFRADLETEKANQDKVRCDIGYSDCMLTQHNSGMKKVSSGSTGSIPVSRPV